MAQVLQLQPSKQESMNSNSSTVHKEKNTLIKENLEMTVKHMEGIYIENN
jgi:predicted DNA-binding protein